MRYVPCLIVGLFITCGELRAADQVEKPRRVPEVTLASPSGEDFKLAEAFNGRPGLLFFYPGGWHPQSVKILKDLRNQEPELTRAGCRIIAITPELPRLILTTLSEHSLPFVVLHDREATLSRYFDLARQLEEEEIRRMTGYGLDIRRRTGLTDVRLPDPAFLWVNHRGQVLREDRVNSLETDDLPGHILSRTRWLIATSSSEEVK